MELSDTVETLETVPEPFRRFYSEGDGGFTLDSEGLQGALGNYDRLLGEKKQAAKRAAELEAKLKKFEGIDDPAAAKKDRAEIQRLKDALEAHKAGLSEDEVEKLLAARHGRIREDYETKLKAKDEATSKLQEELANLKTTLARRSIDSEIAIAVAQLEGFVPEAVDDALPHAHGIFHLEEGVLKPRDQDGALLLGKDGESALTVKEWLESTRKTKPHWWRAQVNGGGAAGSRGQEGGKTVSRKSFMEWSPDKQRNFVRGGGRVVD